MISDKIIGFAGRLQSGKTELANICTEFGYKKLSVATPLKTMIAACLSETIEGINMLKTAKMNYIFDQENQEYIAYCTKVPMEIVHEKLNKKVFENTREMMQFIGTEIIRAHNPNWHVDELRKLIKDDQKYVIDASMTETSVKVPKKTLKTNLGVLHKLLFLKHIYQNKANKRWIKNFKR